VSSAGRTGLFAVDPVDEVFARVQHVVVIGDDTPATSS